MFNQAWQDLWLTLFVILVLIGIFAGQGLVIGFGVIGLLVAGVSWLWNRVSLEEVSYRRDLSERRAFIGEEFSMSVTLVNNKPVPLGRIVVHDEVPDTFTIDDGHISGSASPNSQVLHHATSIGWYERIRWEYRMKCSERGFFRFGPARIESGDLFGFYSSEMTVRDQDYVLVYPRVVPLPELGLPSWRPLGETTGGISAFWDPSRPSGVRDYQSGDPMKIVDWKASAKAAQLRVRTFEPSSTITLVVVVVVETTARYWEGYSPVHLENVITTAASVASYAAERQYNLGMFSNGTPILAERPMKISPSRSPEQLTLILEALATIRPLAMGPMPAQLTEHARRFPTGATLVVIVAFVQPELVEAINSLKRQGYRIVVLYLGDGVCPQMPEGVTVHELQGYLSSIGLTGEYRPR